MAKKDIFGEFVEGKRYKFNKAKFKNCCLSEEDYEENRYWSNACNGADVVVENKYNASVTVPNESGGTITYAVIPKWCTQVREGK